MLVQHLFQPLLQLQGYHLFGGSTSVVTFSSKGSSLSSGSAIVMFQDCRDVSSFNIASSCQSSSHLRGDTHKTRTNITSAIKLLHWTYFRTQLASLFLNPPIFFYNLSFYSFSRFSENRFYEDSTKVLYMYEAYIGFCCILCSQAVYQKLIPSERSDKKYAFTR